MGRHILVINRFANESGRYHRYIDHRADAVSYITSPAGAEAIDTRIAACVEVVPDLANWTHVHACARDIEARHGRVDAVLALSEYDLDLGASVRELLDVAGPRPADIRCVRDKVTMKSRVAEAGLRVPRFATVDDADGVRRFVDATGLPVILKPRAGWDSQGVYLVKSEEGLETLLHEPSLDGYECEAFVDGRMFHVDGIVQDGRVCVLRASRLLGTCLDFALGRPFGSLSNDDVELERRLVGYAERVAAALSMRTSAFHLEVFQTAPAGPGEYDDLVFLEVGARVGGAQIPFIWRDVYGVDLFEAWVRMLLGESPALPSVGPASEAGGYLLMPEPPVRPCRVLHVSSLVAHIPEVYREVVPAPGAILDGTGGCKETAGHYRFRAPTSAQVEDAIMRALAEYELEWEPLDERSAAGAPSHGRAQALVSE